MTGRETDPTRVVADADVLAADLLVGGPSRAVLDEVRRHDWVTLLVSDPLLADTRAVIADQADEELAADWAARIDRESDRVDAVPGGHPGLATAVAGDAGHLLTLDERAASPSAGLSLRARGHAIAVRTPAAFRAVFDPRALYEATVGDEYPGPDREPRASDGRE